MIEKIDKCPITNSDKKSNYFDLGNVPLVNNLYDTREEAISCSKYPLSINYFSESGLTALEHAVDSDILFSNYVFKSGVNEPYKRHCELMFEYIREYKGILEGDIIVDIGGNDGTLLEQFKNKNTQEHVRFLNIDPSSNLSQLSKDKGIDTITEFFTEELVDKLDFRADLITSTNVFQHLKDINSFVRGIKKLLNKDGIWILEFPYWLNSVLTNQFDQIYHEHMYYYSVTPLYKLFKKHGLKILNVDKHEMHGGSLRLLISHKDSKYETNNSVYSYLKEEAKYDTQYYEVWGRDIKEFIGYSRFRLKSMIHFRNKIWGFGAAAKGCVFLNSIGIEDHHIPYVIDDTDLKQGKYIPGTGIKIVDRNILKTEQPHYILILAHNFKDYIMQSLKEYGYKGKFIVLVPKFKIYK